MSAATPEKAAGEALTRILCTVDRVASNIAVAAAAAQGLGDVCQNGGTVEGEAAGALPGFLLRICEDVQAIQADAEAIGRGILQERQVDNTRELAP